jgi:hypothetical protein
LESGCCYVWVVQCSPGKPLRPGALFFSAQCVGVRCKTGAAAYASCSSCCDAAAQVAARGCCAAACR